MDAGATRVKSVPLVFDCCSVGLLGLVWPAACVSSCRCALGTFDMTGGRIIGAAGHVATYDWGWACSLVTTAGSMFGAARRIGGMLVATHMRHARMHLFTRDLRCDDGLSH
eukprot:7569800-Alexandrium_andersonii.AAC.1